MSRGAGTKKDMRAHLRRLRKQGFLVVVAPSGHVRVTNPDGARVMIAGTPATAPALRNCLQRLKKIGYQP